jgi:hypothetical protein
MQMKDFKKSRNMKHETKTGSKVSAVDKRMVLIAVNGELMYPYQKLQKSTGRFGFALSNAQNLDKLGGGDYTTDIEEVVRRVITGGWAVRAKTFSRSGPQREGSMGFNKTAIRDYWLAPELLHLVKGSKLQPVSTIGKFTPNAKA